MRIIGVLLIILSLAPLGFAGWTEFFYLSNVKNTYNSTLDNTKIQYDKTLELYKNNYEKNLEIINSGTPDSESKTELIDELTTTNQKTIEQAKSVFESNINIAKDTMSNNINLVRDMYYITEILVIGAIMLLLGLFLTFRRKS